MYTIKPENRGAAYVTQLTLLIAAANMNIKVEPLGKGVTSDTIVGQGACSVLYGCAL